MQKIVGIRGCISIHFFSFLATVWFCGQSPCQATVYTVTSTADSGVGTLRAAIAAANLNALLPNPGLQNINFQLSSQPYSIKLASALPGVLVPVVIDGTTQPGYAGQPIVELNGNNIANNVGLSLAAGSSTVRGLVLNRFTSYAIQLNGASNTIAGNFIGTDTNGLVALGNSNYGIAVTSSGNVIGGTNAASRNVISGNLVGIYLSSAVGNNVVLGNWIGVNASNSLALPNTSSGIVIANSSGNIIGGTNAGAANIISGNQASGVYLYQPGTSNNVVQGNLIGTDVTGGIIVSNSSYGITINGAPGNLIGPGNVISGNGLAGIIITASSNSVSGNRIGTDITGTRALPNLAGGVTLSSGSASLIGPGNVISGNALAGVTITASSNSVSGNLIGTDITGSVALPNPDGVTLSSGSANLIGPGNVISGNSLAGVIITASSNSLSGNLIGTDITGSVALPNRSGGVAVTGGSANQIGGATAGTGNVISGNLQSGIELVSGTFGNSILGNLIGVNARGTNALGNTLDGISISGSTSNLIGGVLSGARNIISGNSSNGVYIQLAADTGNQVQGNFIGTDITGSKAVANGQSGVYAQGNTNLFGGVAAGAGNVISGNLQEGIFLAGLTSQAVLGNLIQGNIVGLDVTGKNALPNAGAGVGITYGVSNQIGGSIAGARNIISANGIEGIFELGAKTTGNVIQGNYIGTDITGRLARGNAFEGIYIQDANGTQIGGAVPGAGNLISGNITVGIWFTNTSLNVIQGNIIGADVTGTNNLGNGEHGLDFEAAANNNIVGGTSPLAANIIAYAQNSYSGVRIRNGASNNLISANSIFGNTGYGIDLGAFGANPIVNCEAGVAANAANAGQNFPVITNVVCGSGGTVIRGNFDSAAGQTYQLQFFANPTMGSFGYGQGQVYLGGTTAALGAACTTNFAVFLPAVVPVGWSIAATATGPGNNTSDFSADVLATSPPPLQLILTGPTYHSVTNHKGMPVIVTTFTNLVISYTNVSGPFTLQETFSLGPPVTWFPITNSAVMTNGVYSIVNPIGRSNAFFRITAP